MSRETLNVLVTGTNGGLGLGICQRLIDDFLRSDEATASLNIIYTTRSARKSSETLKTLQTHLHGHHPSALHGRVTFQAENVELTNLVSVLALARKLLSSDLPKIDAIICNAGIGGWVGLDWPRLVRDLLVDMRSNTTWPMYKLGIVGAITKPQLPEGKGAEPPLGEVFCANLFGHYLLVHWLMPLLRACEGTSPGKIIWVSSIEPHAKSFSVDDLQGLRTDAAYESSKRVTDLLGLSANLPETEKSTASFSSLDSPLTADATEKAKRVAKSVPTQYVYQPGIVVTSVMTLYWIISQAYLLGIYIARWLGGVWSTVQPYTAAHGATWLALSSPFDIQQAETDAHPITSTAVIQNGHVKWGTSVNRAGKTTVRATEVDKWGIRGSGTPFASTWWGGSLGRRPGAVEAKPEDVKEFVALASQVWEKMEELREDWERRIAEAEVASSTK